MARITGTVLTPRHEEILTFAYYYYKLHQVGPAFFILKKALKTDKTELDQLFPYGLNSVYTWIGIPIHSLNDTCRPPISFKADDYREVYLDHNATTYVRPEIRKVLEEFYSEQGPYANPSSSTEKGRNSYELILESRLKIAKLLSTQPERIIFSGSGTESINLAVKGLAFQRLEEKGHIITSLTEHSCVLETVKYLEEKGFTATFLQPDSEGRVTVKQIESALQEDTFLVAIMAVNNEIGTISPVKDISALCNKHGVHFVVDAVQAFGKIPLYPEEWGVSCMAFSGHKLYAPKGVGGLYLGEFVDLEPILHGGGQESGLRSGTENVGHILALGKAAELARLEMAQETERLWSLQQYFLEQLKEIEPGFKLNGPDVGIGPDSERMPSNLNIGFPGVDSGTLLLALDQVGIMVSTGSACSSGKIKSSHVLEAINADLIQYGVIRFGLGLRTSKQDLDYLFKYLPKILKEIRN